jgi:hypothetical protein
MAALDWTLTTATASSDVSWSIAVPATSGAGWAQLYGSSGAYATGCSVSLARGNSVLTIDGQGAFVERLPKKLQAGQAAEMELPDGSVLHVDALGNFRIDDRDSQVVYRANRVREFNRYVNASDLLEEFMAFVRPLGVRRGELLRLPLELFIRFLIVRAAEADGDVLPEAEAGPPLEAQVRKALPPPRPRCLGCGRFLRRQLQAAGILFCSGAHLDRYAARKALAAP